MNKTITIVNALAAKARTSLMNNQEHLVIPVIALKESILNNLYYSPEEIQKSAQSWNGCPVPVNHPQKDGVNVTANSVEVEQSQNIGKVYGARYVDGSLKCEIWINTSKAKELGFEDILNNFKEGKMMEVSTGLRSDIVRQSGMFNNNKYELAVKNILPDHIALLTNQPGACSIEDGCGALRNNCDCDETKVNAEMSQSDVRQLLSTWLNTHIEAQEDSFLWVVEVYDNYFVFENNDVLYRKNYSIDALGNLTVDDNSVLVERVTTFEPAGGGLEVQDTIGNSSDNQEVIPMEDKKKVVEAIIANEQTQFTEKDSETLMGLSDEVLAKMSPLANEDEAGSAKETLTNEQSDKLSPEATPAGAQLSQEDMILFNQLKAEKIEVNKQLRQKVLDNVKGMTAEIVNNMDMEAVKALADNIKPAADYSAGNGFVGNTQQGSGYKKPAILLANVRKGNTDESQDKEEVVNG